MRILNFILLSLSMFCLVACGVKGNPVPYLEESPSTQKEKGK